MIAVKLLNRSFLRSARPQTPSRILHRAMAAPVVKQLHVLRYEFVEGMAEKRGPYREAHLKQASEKAAEGKLVLAGALGAAAKNGLMIFQNASPEEIEAYAKDDPYSTGGLVTKWSIEPYAVVDGCLKNSL